MPSWKKDETLFHLSGKEKRFIVSMSLFIAVFVEISKYSNFLAVALVAKKVNTIRI